MTDITITSLDASPATRAMLCEILIGVVAAGGSVSFMHPLDPAAADAYWLEALGAAARGERVVLGAWDGDLLVGTVTLMLELPENQPHRAEVAKLMTRPTHRGQGIATTLMSALEVIAIERGRTLLVLDTAVDGGAGSLYTRLGFALTGEIPDYALKPHGGLTGTLIFWKRIGAAAMRDNADNANGRERSVRP
ncbi:MAG: GNAT family N-acetyltransferase [Candidatus Dormibacteria bacterium]